VTQPPDFWLLDPSVVFLNHGSFGSCPRPVLEFQQAIRLRMERQPVQFFVRDLEALLDEARTALAEFIGAAPENLVFVPNATAGVNTVLRSLSFEQGDEVIVTNHEYNACRNALDVVAARCGLRVVVAEVPFPLRSVDQIIEPILCAASPRTRLLLVDHITSQTGLIFPIEKIIAELASRGVDTLVDGAHAPGMIPLELERLGAACYTGNCHKWLCAPKGAGFLYIRPDRQRLIRPLSISHGANSPRTDRSRHQIEFGWTGTADPSPYLCVRESIRVMGSVLSGGWPELMRQNRALALEGRKLVAEALKIEPPCPDSMIGSLASFPLPDGASTEPPTSPLYSDPLQDSLLREHRIEVPVIPWPSPPRRLLRISAQIYNTREQYALLAEALKKALAY
jgi:isopenicillin-N epimerase